MNRSLVAASRTIGVLAVSAAAIYGGSQASGTITVPGLDTTRQASGAVTTPVSRMTLVCPGIPTVGLAGVRDMAATGQLAGATAPTSLLPGVATAESAGSNLIVGTAPAVTRRGVQVTGKVSTGEAQWVRATGSLAPALTATQEIVVSTESLRGLATTSCRAGAAEHWLVAGGAGPGRQERLVLVNPSTSPATVDIEVFGAEGRIESPVGAGVIVPAQGRVAMLVDAIAQAEGTPVVHVTATGGIVTATLDDSWLEGLTLLGVDDAEPSAAPATEHVIPAVPVDGAARVRVLAPGDSEAIVEVTAVEGAQVRALPKGSAQRIAAGHVVEFDLAGLPIGTHAIRVEADVPVVAGAFTSRRAGSGPGDFAWSAAAEPLTGLAGLTFTGNTTRSLSLHAGSAATVEVTTVTASGEATSNRVTLAAATQQSVTVPAGTAAVWVRPVDGGDGLTAAVVNTVGTGAGQLVSVTSLRPSRVLTTRAAVIAVP